jgi:hypothetical protein
MYKIYESEYKSKSIVRLLDNAFIPFDEANTDYQAYLTWVAEGNKAKEWNPGGSE